MRKRKLALDKLNDLDGTDPGKLPPHFIDAPDMQKKYPNLYDLLYRRQLNGEDRPGGSLTLFLDEGVLKVVVVLKGERRRAFLTLSDPFHVFGALEAELASRGLDWRPLKEDEKPGKKGSR